MKKVICFVLVAALLLSLAGCGGKGDVLSATGKYNGQKITMTYKVTDVIYPYDMRGIYMSDGYAIFYDYTFNYYQEDYTLVEKNDAPYDHDTWNVLDRSGNRLLDEPYMRLTNFNFEGIAAAQKQDGTFVLINKKFEEMPITEKEFTSFANDPKNGGFIEDEEEYLRIGDAAACINDGLALYAVEKDNGKYLAGLADAEGNIVVPAFISIHYLYEMEGLHLHEGVAFVEDYETHNIGIITVTRS